MQAQCKSKRKHIHICFWKGKSLLCVCVCLYVLSHIWLFGLHGLQPARVFCPWNFSRREYCSRLPSLTPGDLPDPGAELVSHDWQAGSSPLRHLGSPTPYDSCPLITGLHSRWLIRFGWVNDCSEWLKQGDHILGPINKLMTTFILEQGLLLCPGLSFL